MKDVVEASSNQELNMILETPSRFPQFAISARGRLLLEPAPRSCILVGAEIVVTVMVRSAGIERRVQPVPRLGYVRLSGAAS